MITNDVFSEAKRHKKDDKVYNENKPEEMTLRNALEFINNLCDGNCFTCQYCLCGECEIRNNLDPCKKLN